MNNLNQYFLYCPVCGGSNKFDANYCMHCGKKFQTNQTFQEQLNTTNTEEEKIRCPNCKSTQITAHKKGFSGIKAVGGAVLTGGIGILAGTIGSNKILLTCLSCGNKFKAGEDYEGLRRKRKQEEEAMKNPIFWILMIGLFTFFIWLVRSC